MKYTQSKPISLKNHPDFRETWVQNLIAEDPTILGLGDLVLRDRERQQPRAGRLDLLLTDTETKRRYEVELQLGQTDETHIIRTIEYWDIERKRYPQYDHCAVIIAENITSRFLNVIGLFNGSIPLIAIQMSAFQVGDHTSILFTKVLDELQRGLVDEDEDALSAPTDRKYWENRSTPKMLKVADKVLEDLRLLDKTLELNYNKPYIGLFKDGKPFNFITLRPRKARLNVDLKLPKSEELDELIEQSGLDTLDYDSRWRCYRLALEPSDIERQEGTLRDLYQRAYNFRVG